MAEPISLAAEPSEIKINDNPALNASELSMTQLRVVELESPCFIWSTLIPEINEIYPGTSGNTHGDRNDAKPATKAIPIVMFV
jgi:hypothetical protein